MSGGNAIAKTRTGANLIRFLRPSVVVSMANKHIIRSRFTITLGRARAR